MLRRILIGKIHRATVTEADLNYEGSVTVDSELLSAAGIVAHEEVHIWNVTRGSRLTTYAMPGDAGSGVVCANGAAAHLNRPGDRVILAAYGYLTQEVAVEHSPRVVMVDGANRIIGLRPERAGPARATGVKAC